MKSISIYQRRRFFYLAPNAHTVHRVGITTGPCIKLPVASTTPAELGEAARQTLAHAGAIVPHPEDWSKLPRSPVLEAAGVKNWATFSRGAKNVSVALLEHELTLTPTHRERGQNFMHQGVDDDLRLPIDPTPAEFGEAISRALARSR